MYGTRSAAGPNMSSCRLHQEHQLVPCRAAPHDARHAASPSRGSSALLLLEVELVLVLVLLVLLVLGLLVLGVAFVFRVHVPFSGSHDMLS